MIILICVAVILDDVVVVDVAMTPQRHRRAVVAAVLAEPVSFVPVVFVFVVPVDALPPPLAVAGDTLAVVAAADVGAVPTLVVDFDTDWDNVPDAVDSVVLVVFDVPTLLRVIAVVLVVVALEQNLQLSYFLRYSIVLSFRRRPTYLNSNYTNLRS